MKCYPQATIKKPRQREIRILTQAHTECQKQDYNPDLPSQMRPPLRSNPSGTLHEALSKRQVASAGVRQRVRTRQTPRQTPKQTRSLLSQSSHFVCGPDPLLPSLEEGEESRSVRTSTKH